MKKIVSILLALAALLTATACSGARKSSAKLDAADMFYKKICNADEALEWAKSESVVVMENGVCTSGKELWKEFYKAADNGRECSVLLASCYTLDRERVSPELYEEEKDDYPALFFNLLEFDGDKYTATSRESDEKTPDYNETFRYLNHFAGAMPKDAEFSSYDRYVLVDDKTVTWEDIERGMVSSQLGDGHRFYAVYSDYAD